MLFFPRIEGKMSFFLKPSFLFLPSDISVTWMRKIIQSILCLIISYPYDNITIRLFLCKRDMKTQTSWKIMRSGQTCLANTGGEHQLQCFACLNKKIICSEKLTI